jgi:hypothetical protein
MVPGLILMASMPASIAISAILWLKWTSPMMGMSTSFFRKGMILQVSS